MRNFILIFVFLYSNFLFSKPINNIIVIHSYSNNNKITLEKIRGFDYYSKNENAIFHHEFLNSDKIENKKDNSEFSEYLHEKFQKKKVDFIILSNEPALNFIKRNPFLFKEKEKAFIGRKLIKEEGVKIKFHFEEKNYIKIINDIKKITNSDDLVIISNNNSSSMEKIKNIKSRLISSNISYIYKKNEIKKQIKEIKPNTPILVIDRLNRNSFFNSLYSWNKSVNFLRDLSGNIIFTLEKSTLLYGSNGAFEFDYFNFTENISITINKYLNKGEIHNHKKNYGKWFFNKKDIDSNLINPIKINKNFKVIEESKFHFLKNKKHIELLISFIFYSIFISFFILIIRKEVKELIKNRKKNSIENARVFYLWKSDLNGEIEFTTGNIEKIFNEKNIAEKKLNFYKIYNFENVLEFPIEKCQSAINNLTPINKIFIRVKTSKKQSRTYEMIGDVVFNDNGKGIGYQGILKENITNSKNKKIEKYDNLTGLINRESFIKKLNGICIKKRNNSCYFLCILDLDHFKLINDLAGHVVGDQMLYEVSYKINELLSKKDIFGRLGGDEFGLILSRKNQDHALEICESIQKTISNFKFSWKKKSFDLGISIGMIEIDKESDVNETLRKGSLSCHKAKELGRGRVFSGRDTNHNLEAETAKIGYISNISQAIKNQYFFLTKQIIKPLNGKKELYYEILIRLKDDKENLISPSIFIPEAEKYGGIMLIDQWVLTNILDNYGEYFLDKNTKVSINLSTVSLSNENFLLTLKNIISHSKVNLSNICFEITETALVSNLKNALKFIFEMKQVGIQFALDDFGSGSSSFEYLKNLPVDYVKIDGSLIKNIDSEPVDYEIVKSINKIAKMMGMKTIAEFVENKEVELILHEIGIDYVQGFHIGKPERLHSLFDKNRENNEKETFI